MRRSARTDLCGGRSAMIVPTATSSGDAVPITLPVWVCGGDTDLLWHKRGRKQLRIFRLARAEIAIAP